MIPPETPLNLALRLKSCCKYVYESFGRSVFLHFDEHEAATILKEVLAKHEAQVRAEEREKVAGLVEAAQAVVNRFNTIKAGNRAFWGTCFQQSNDIVLMETLAAQTVTYNDNRKG